MRSGYKTNRLRLAIAQQVACLLDGTFPTYICEAVAASCYFTIHGPGTVGYVQKNWFEWVRTNVWTSGHMLSTRAWQGSRSGWLNGSSKEVANSILESFGLDIEAVLDYYGHPTVGQTKTLYLADIIYDLASDLLDSQALSQVA